MPPLWRTKHLKQLGEDLTSKLGLEIKELEVQKPGHTRVRVQGKTAENSKMVNEAVKQIQDQLPKVARETKMDAVRGRMICQSVFCVGLVGLVIGQTFFSLLW